MFRDLSKATVLDSISIAVLAITVLDDTRITFVSNKGKQSGLMSVVE